MNPTTETMPQCTPSRPAPPPAQASAAPYAPAAITPALQREIQRLRMELIATTHAVDAFVASVGSGLNEVSSETILSCSLAHLLEQAIWVFTQVAPWHVPRVRFE